MSKFEFIWPISERTAIRQVLRVHSLGLTDLREVWDRFIPNIRRRHSVTFRQMASPFGEIWAPLTPRYAAWKLKHFGDKRILERTGALRRAASEKGAPGQFIEMQPLRFVFGVNLGSIYPAVHQAGKKRRTWLGLKVPDDLIALQAQIKAYFLRLQGKVTAIGRGRAF